MSTNAQIPRAADGLVCPLHKADTAEVCHRCPLWVQIRGTDPQTGAEVDRWSCSLSLLPMLLIEGAHQTRQLAGATESFRNEMSTAHQVAQAMFTAAVTSPPAPVAMGAAVPARPGLLGRVFRLGRG